MQHNVYNIAESYQLLLAADFIDGILPTINTHGAFTVGQNYLFIDTKISVPAMFSRLSNPGNFLKTADIHQLAPNSFICDFIIIFADVTFVMQIFKVSEI